MSIKSLIQIFIFVLIIFIISAVYYKYFNINQNMVEEINSLEIANQNQIRELETKISELELENNELLLKNETSKKAESKSIENQIEKNSKKVEVIKDNTKKKDVKKENTKKEEVKEDNQNNSVSSSETKNLVKDVEYRSIDEKGNNFYLLANSGKSNIDNKDILDLVNVRGEITSDNRDTIYIVSDYAQFNSVNSNSKFYDNVVINYQEKQITCLNFDINMETSKAIAYNDVKITDPKSIMKAGLVEFDLKTKNININPESLTKDIQVISN